LPIIDPNIPKLPLSDSSFSTTYKIQQWLYRIEDGLLVGLLLLMILLAATQIFLRNFLDIGLVWADILVRILVLWVGLVGAMAASRKGDHIKIDLISKYLKPKLTRIVMAITDFFTAVVCGLVLFYSIKFIRFEYMDGIVAFGRIPVWFCQAIIPFSFLVMSLRYFAGTILNLQTYFNQKV
jgi:TRAP-type C4-dicarboxylate transport system permease small subunit